MIWKSWETGWSIGSKGGPQIPTGVFSFVLKDLPKHLSWKEWETQQFPRLFPIAIDRFKRRNVSPFLKDWFSRTEMPLPFLPCFFLHKNLHKFCFCTKSILSLGYLWSSKGRCRVVSVIWKLKTIFITPISSYEVKSLFFTYLKYHL